MENFKKGQEIQIISFIEIGNKSIAGSIKSYIIKRINKESFGIYNSSHNESLTLKFRDIECGNVILLTTENKEKKMKELKISKDYKNCLKDLCKNVSWYSCPYYEEEDVLDIKKQIKELQNKLIKIEKALVSIKEIENKVNDRF